MSNITNGDFANNYFKFGPLSDPEATANYYATFYILHATKKQLK